MGGDRQSVKTYVPTEQKDLWRDHAEKLDMTPKELIDELDAYGDDA